MDEKTMVNDILSCSKSDLSNYQKAIVESENMELRQTLKQLRDNYESFQYELFKVANSKGYYVPDTVSSVQEIQAVKKELENE